MLALLSPEEEVLKRTDEDTFDLDISANEAIPLIWYNVTIPLCQETGRHGELE